MQTVQSGYVELEIVAPSSVVSATGDLTFNITATFKSLTAATSRSQIGVIPLEMILIGSETYIRNPITQAWEDASDSRLPFDVSSISSFSNVLSFGAFTTDFDPEVLAGFTLVGEELINGERTYYVRGTVGGEALAAARQSGRNNVGFWIGVDDSRIRKVSILPAGSDTSNAGDRQIRLRQSGRHGPCVVELDSLPRTGRHHADLNLP